MFAVGHLALGYITGKVTDRLLNVKSNIVILLLVSIIPDIDLLIPGLAHRGPTHSLIFLFILLIPAFLINWKKTIPYFIALVQHILIGDYITESLKLLWPFTQHLFGTGMNLTSLPNIIFELCSFITFMVLLLKSKDIRLFFQNYRFNILLSIPLFSVLMPVVFKLPTYVPLELLIPHFIFLLLFILSIIKTLKTLLSK